VCMVRCAVYCVVCVLGGVRCVLWGVLCVLCGVRCVLWDVLCVLCGVRCVLWDVLCGFASASNCRHFAAADEPGISAARLLR